MVFGTRTRTRTKGFSFVEVLIALTLMAVLMTSIAAVVHASLQSYRENELITSMTQAARSILTRMMRDVPHGRRSGLDQHLPDHPPTG